MTFLRDEFDEMLKKYPRKNFHVSSWSMRPTWGSVTHMHMFIRVMQDLTMLKKTTKWNWDFMINLSESDFPLK
jgi:hypothetical protein